MRPIKRLRLQGFMQFVCQLDNQRNPSPHSFVLVYQPMCFETLEQNFRSLQCRCFGQGQDWSLFGCCFAPTRWLGRGTGSVVMEPHWQRWPLLQLLEHPLLQHICPFHRAIWETQARTWWPIWLILYSTRLQSTPNRLCSGWWTWSIEWPNT